MDNQIEKKISLSVNNNDFLGMFQCSFVLFGIHLQ